MNEVTVIHPLVKHRLEQCGYTYQHEYEMPDYGRVDFYAQKEGEKSVLIEAKVHNSRKVVIQLAAYGLQMPECRMIIALPRTVITPEIRTLAAKYNMEIMSLFTPFFMPQQIAMKNIFVSRVQSAINHMFDEPYLQLGEKLLTQHDYEMQFSHQLFRLCKDYHEWFSLLDMIPDLITIKIAEHVGEASFDGVRAYWKHTCMWLHRALGGDIRNFFDRAKIRKVWIKK